MFNYSEYFFFVSVFDLGCFVAERIKETQLSFALRTPSAEHCIRICDDR